MFAISILFGKLCMREDISIGACAIQNRHVIQEKQPRTLAIAVPDTSRIELFQKRAAIYLIRNNNLWISGVLKMDIPSLGNLIHCIVVIDVTNFTDYTTIDNKSIMIPKVGIQPHLLYKVTATWCNICSNIIVALDGLQEFQIQEF